MKHSLIVLFILLATFALAQEKPATVEVTGAYQFTRVVDVNVPAGWDASVNVPANKWFGVAGDFGGFSKSEFGVTATVYTYGGGPQFTLRTRNVEPYFRFILGGAHGTASGFGLSEGTNAFFYSPGGGADFRISDRTWFRLGANYPSVRKFGVTANGIQAVVGITYKFGGRRETAANTTAPPTGAAAPLLGAVVNSKMHIIRFFPDSVLSNHGLELGDVINSVDDKDVKSPEELTAATASLTKGTRVKIGYLSHGQWQTWIYIQL
jgi:hypothetical protein